MNKQSLSRWITLALILHVSHCSGMYATLHCLSILSKIAGYRSHQRIESAADRITRAVEESMRLRQQTNGIRALSRPLGPLTPGSSSHEAGTETVASIPESQPPKMAQNLTAIEGILKEAQKSPYGNITLINIMAQDRTVNTASSVSHSQSSPHDITEWARALKNKAEEASSSLFEWAKKNKGKFALSCAGGVYASLQVYLWYLTAGLQKSTCWSLWKHTVPLEELYRYKQADLAHDVMETIRFRYQNTLNPRDAVSPLTSFLKESEDEIKALNTYRGFVHFIDQLHLKRIFFYNATLYNEALERINRLLFLKNSVLASMHTKKNDTF